MTLSPLIGAIANVSFNSDDNASLFTSDSDQCHLMMVAGVVPDDGDHVILSPKIVTVLACVPPCGFTLCSCRTESSLGVTTPFLWGSTIPGS